MPDDPAHLLDDRTRLYDQDAQRPERRLSLGWIDALVRHRHWAFALVALLYIASFNGLWRVGVDSALYRGLAHSLATGQGYRFGGEAHHHAFFGVPWMLAICERLFGDNPIYPTLLITAMAGATIWLTYRLIALHYPIWVATIVAIGMGTNFRFLRLSQELMTDVPFALGVVATLYGLERLRMNSPRAHGAMVAAGAMMIAGLLLSAATRPTVGVLAGAIVLASVIRAIRNEGGRRWLHVSLCVAAAAAVLLLFFVDPRTRGFSPTAGVYEQELIDSVQTLPVTLAGRIDKFLSTSLNDAFFSQKMQPASFFAALLVLAGAMLVLRRNLAWGLMVIGVVLVTLPLSTVPRYYLMVMPILWLGWLLLFSRITLAAPPMLRGAVMMLAVGVPLGMNVGRDFGFIQDQRAGDVAWMRTGMDRAAGFYASYRGGEVPRLQGIAAMIQQHVPAEGRVVGPNARILTYYSGRLVGGEREIFDKVDGKITQYPAALRRFEPDFAIFPSRAYDDGERHLRDLIRRRILAPAERPVATTSDGITLARAALQLPPAGVNWKTYKHPTTPLDALATTRRVSPLRGLSTTQRAEVLARRARRAEVERKQQARERRERAEAQTRRERAERRAEQEARQERQRRREAAERRERAAAKDRKAQRAAATQPATVPTLP